MIGVYYPYTTERRTGSTPYCAVFVGIAVAKYKQDAKNAAFPTGHLQT
ncbi:MAG: hypothetical protein IJF39_02820 [Clostridia bacterium]|nr:hypothetical protein [Clostridia bacterium]